MAPNVTRTPCTTGVLHEDEDAILADEVDVDGLKKPGKRRLQLVWRNIFLFVYLHGAALYGTYLVFTEAKIITTLFAIFLYQVGATGVTAGAHRLWSHRAYKAKWPLRVLLMLMNTIAFQDAVVDWARDHRVHHKFSETDADPHNAKRGFFFCHVGWLLCKKHPMVKEKGKGFDLSDLYNDPVLSFQKRNYMILMPLMCFIMPTVVPVMLWGETWKCAWFVSTMWRYTITLNVTWLVNSAAHMWGNRPYDKYINPSENLTVSILALGEGWHNYHHTFPWDYKTAELGSYRTNFTTAFIDFFAKIGWAYDMKTVSSEMIRKRVKRTGDGSHELWGWGDEDQPPEEKKEAIVLHPQHSSTTACHENKSS